MNNYNRFVNTLVSIAIECDEIIREENWLADLRLVVLEE
jgi:hypothetical protein